MLTQNQVQDSRTEQVIKHHTWRKRQTSHTRHTIKERDECHIKKRKTDKTSLPPTSAQTQTTHPREESHPKETKRKKEKPHDTFPPHQPASPRDSSRHRPASNHPSTSPSSPTLPPHLLPSPIPTPYPHTVHTPTDTCYHPLSTYCLPPLYTPPALPLIVTVPPPVSTLLLATVPMPVSVSLPLALNTAVPLPDGRYARLATHCSPVPSTQPPLSAYCTHVCLRYCDHLAIIMPTILGSAPVLTTLHRPHPLIVTPGHLRYHQSLTRVHSHSLPVPPPLPLADARSQGGFTVGRSRSLACGLWCPLVLHGSPCW